MPMLGGIPPGRELRPRVNPKDPSMPDYPKPSLTVDAVVLSGLGRAMRILLIQRAKPPFQGDSALPGGFVDPYEAPLQACLRELEEETGLVPDISRFVPLSLRAREGRDPRGWTISQPFLFYLPDPLPPRCGDDAASAFWQPLAELDRLAFDHGAILCEALGRFWPCMPTHVPPLRHIAAFGVPEPLGDRLVFFGGSFNPWHQGHEACVSLFPAQEGRLLVLPDANPFKAASFSSCAWQHYRALRERVEPYHASVFPGFCAMETPNPTVAWLPYTRAASRGLLLGEDSLVSLPSWRQAEHLVRHIDQLFVAPRRATDEARDAALHWLRTANPRCGITLLEDHPFRDVSATALRGKAKS